MLWDYLRIRDSLTRSRDLGDRPGMIECLETVAREAQDAHTGALLLGAAEAARTAAGVILQPDETAWVEATTATLRAALGPPAFGTALADGAALALEDAVERALAVT